MPVRKLGRDALTYIARERAKGVPARRLAEALGVTERHVRRVWASCSGGAPPAPRPMGRPRKEADPEAVRAVLAARMEQPCGVAKTAACLRGSNISHYAVCRVLKAHGMVEECPARRGRRRWVRFERRYSNALWHVDIHMMRHPDYEGKYLIAFLDDASRCITGWGVYEHAVSEAVVDVLRGAMREFRRPAQILSDNGPQFTSARRGEPRGSWRPTAFERELLNRGIELINSRPYHPQTNGKMERFFRTLEEELPHFGDMTEFVPYYNERRLHFSLDMRRGQTPLRAFRDKAASKEARKDPRWMEADIHG